VTNELENAGPELASDIVGRVLAEAVTTQLDRLVFDNEPADDARPAGLLYGVAPAAVATSGGGLNAIVADLANIAGKFAEAGIGGDDAVIIANPRQGIVLKLLAGPAFDYPILASAGIPDGRVIVVAPASVASGYSGLPTITKHTSAAIHMEDTSPLQISAGSPAVLAAPTRSIFQTDATAIRVRGWEAWAAVTPGGVQYVDAVTW
jgi:hypothetical protein